MSPNHLVQFTNLKRKICEAARNALIAANPEYVQTFLRRLEETSGDLDRVIDETKPLLGERLKDWTDLLNAVLDVELVLDKAKRSLMFLRSDIEGTPEESGAWVVYHIDHWTFQMDALLERVDKLVALVLRRLVRPKDNTWQAKQKAIRDDVKKMKDEIAKRRDPLAHGLGGGVLGIQEERLWEPFLAGRAFDVDIVASFYERASPKKQRWHSFLEPVTILAFGAVEAISEKLCEYVT